MGGACGTYGKEERLIQSLGEEYEGKRPLGRPDVDGRVILRLIFRKLEGVVRPGWSWLRIGTRGGRL